MPSRPAPLQTLRAFDAAARLLSFTEAGRALNVSQSAVSQQIQLLEDSLGARLFTRRIRGLGLTAAGERFAAATATALGLIDDAARDVAGQPAEQDLTVAVVPSLASRWLVPRLPRFRTGNPGIDVAIVPAFTPREVEQAGADLGILYGDGDWPDHRARLLRSDRVFPVCRPDLMPGGRVERADALFEHTLLRDADPRHEYWPAWLAAAGATRRAVRRGPRFDNQSDMIAAALDGQGIALARQTLVSDDLAAGRLIQPFPTAIASAFAYYAVWPRRPRPHTQAGRFVEWMTGEI